MSKSVIGALRVNLGLDSAQFEKGAKRSQNTLAAMRKQFLVVAGAAAAMGAALSTAALKGAQDIDRAAKAARRLDSSVGGFRALELAAGEAGVSMSVLADSVQTMDREIAKGSKGAGEALERLGLTARSLEGLDADQKIATIADAIQDMGLTTADASVVLQQLGVRNREMVLAVTSGGAALRDARRDIEDYGLAINAVDSARIEKANDQIGRLGLISQYAGQQLAIALVPAMGRLAQVMTDSLREGGLLREVIDGLVNNLDVLAFSAVALSSVLGARLAVALAASTLAIGKKIIAVGVLTSAMTALRFATALAGGPLGVVAALLTTGAAAAVIFGRDTETAGEAAYSTAAAAAQLGGELHTLSGTDLPAATAKTVDLANANLTLARSAFAAAEAQNQLAIAGLRASEDQLGIESMSGIESDLLPGQAARIKALERLLASQKALKDAEAELTKKVMEGERVKAEATETVRDLTVRVDGLTDAAGGAGGGMKKAKDDAEDMAGAFDGPVTSAIDGVAQAFGDFVARGFKDFKGLTQSILSSFKSMLAQMIATAARNKIMLAIGGTASVAGGAANAAGGLLGGIGGAVGAAGGIGGALSAVGSGLGGILSGGGLGASFANLGGLVTGASGGLGAIGAALPALGVIAAPLAIGALLLGRRRKRRRRRREAEQRRVAAEQAEQQRLAQVAEVAFGMDNRILELQGRGMEALTRVRERELSTIDASLRPRLEQIYALEDQNQGWEIQNRLLELQGRSSEVLARNRKRELGATADANKALLRQVFALEDQQEAAAAAANALEEANRRIEAFAGNANNFATRADQQFAATSGGFQGSAEVISLDLQRELIRAVREGDVNNARITTKLLQIEERKMLEPGA